MSTEDRKRQVKTTKENHGDDFYKKAGSAGGKKSTTKFNSDAAKKAVEARWAKYREQKEKEKGN